MKIAILHSVAEVSAEKLKEGLKSVGHRVDIHRPYVSGRSDFSKYDLIFNFGYGGGFYSGDAAVINSTSSVLNCISKVKTFEELKKAGVPTLNYVTRHKDIPKSWEQVAVRSNEKGRKGEDLDFFFVGDKKMPKDAPLYTEVYHAPNEYRVVVFTGVCIGVYLKVNKGTHISLEYRHPDEFKTLAKAAERAATALKMDYVGFDVLAQNKRVFAFLEANSAAMMCDETLESIVDYYS